MIWLVLLGSGLLLASITQLDQASLQLLLILCFFLTGVLFHKGKLRSYLIFTFLYPLLPSQAPELSPFDFLEFLFLCFAFWWSLDKIVNRAQKPPSSAIHWVLGSLLVICSISVFLSLLRHNYLFSEVFLLKMKESWNVFDLNSASNLVPLHALIHFFEGLTFFYITIDIVKTKDIRRVVRMIVYSAVIVSIIGILQRLWKFSLLEHWVIENPNIARINSTFSDPNSLGTYLATALCLTVFAFFARKTGRPKIIFLFIPVLFVALILTTSRAAWAATFLTILIFPTAGKWLGINPFLQIRKSVARIPRYGPYIAFGILLVLLGTAAVANYSDHRPDSLLKVVLFTFNPELSLNVILKGRVELWKHAIAVFKDYPVFGSGLGSLPSLQNAPYFVSQPENAHNYFLQILAEAGLTGFLLFVLALSLVFREVRRKLQSAADSEYLLLYGLLAGLIAFLCTSITGHPLLLLKLQFVFWSMIAVLVLRPGSESYVRLSRYKPILFVSGIIIAVSFWWQIHRTLELRRLIAYEHGYHAWEKDEQGLLFRWTTAEALSELDVQGEVLSFSLRQLNPQVLKGSTFVNLYLNDQLLDRISFTNTNWRPVRYFVAHVTKHQRAVTLRIVPEKVFRPGHRSEERELGVAVRNFVWECAGTNPIGVYDLEREMDKTYYWTGAQASFPLKAEGKLLTFHVLPNPSVETAPVHVRFYWDRKGIHEMTFSNMRWAPVTLRIPDGEDRDGVLTVQVSQTANLRQMNRGSDSRDLGVRIEFPFRWSGTVTTAHEPTKSLSNPVVYGVNNNGNRPFRLILFPLEKYSSSDFQISSNGRTLKHLPGIVEAISATPGAWVQLYPEKPFQRSSDLSLWTIKRNVKLPSGFFLLRMTALGSIVGGDVPIVSLRVDDREVARQPLVYDRWIDYYFTLDLPDGGNSITVQFANYFYDPVLDLGRNAMVSEIAISKGGSSVELSEGWDVLRNNVIIAEPVDRNFPFLPRNNCYTMEPEE